MGDFFQDGEFWNVASSCRRNNAKSVIFVLERGPREKSVPVESLLQLSVNVSWLIIQCKDMKKGSLSSLKLTNLNIVSLMCMSRPPCNMSLLVARFHTSANLYWQLFWQNYTVLGSNFQVLAKTRHFYYQQPFPFPFRLKELFKVLSVFDDCLVNKTREGKKIALL